MHTGRLPINIESLHNTFYKKKKKLNLHKMLHTGFAMRIMEMNSENIKHS